MPQSPRKGGLDVKPIGDRTQEIILRRLIPVGAVRREQRTEGFTAKLRIDIEREISHAVVNVIVNRVAPSVALCTCQRIQGILVLAVSES